jgi:hypothetical protein
MCENAKLFAFLRLGRPLPYGRVGHSTRATSDRHGIREFANFLE